MMVGGMPPYWASGSLSAHFSPFVLLQPWSPCWLATTRRPGTARGWA